ncbi:glycoside hydrolase family 18 protein [Phlebiopsis gigantea 11061_1 CR5-6]|uniref:Glycoside hydrolase family 18 protein n=1 Tax=Phlebiopsis gigantea (strain 11061_1 CR5-6) TaxID=745531 RepID=A0A0C3NM81_PHLG1|nr:glycoside hydrolase family 18 protein [Phlebiopsis gigantea 11061_1 CR5-6]
MTVERVAITGHTTASLPRPHVLYHVEIHGADGSTIRLTKRYSDFQELHHKIGDKEVLPPKRILVTTFLPAAWVDDKLIAERKTGLAVYLNSLLKHLEYRESPILQEFLSSSIRSSESKDFNPEDALPSTLSRKAALAAQVKTAAASKIAAAYYPDWSADSIPPESLDYSKFDILFFAFATPNSSSGISYDSGSTSILKRLVSAAKSSGKGTKIVLSIGGWDGSYWFSQAVSSSANRSTFVNAAVSAVNTYGLDGIDIDWEYPNSEGAGNPHSSSDSANLLSFFTSLRSALGSSKLITAAVTHQPWLGSNGSPLTNVASYAAQMSYVNIMNYDVWGASTTDFTDSVSTDYLFSSPVCFGRPGASSTPGPNAPLGNLCGTSRQPQASAQAAFSQWTEAGFPASKLLLGLPLYGYVSKSSATTLTGIALPPPGFDVQQYRERVLQLPRRGVAPACPLVRETFDAEPNFLDGAHARATHPADTKAVRAAAAGDLSSYYGQQIAFNQIVALGALTKASNGTYVQANGYTEGWDDCSDTPFLFDVARQTVVTYDDTYSLADKAAYAKSSGMAGCFTWSLDQDDGYTLQNVIRSSLGK